jgi:predicted RNA-binding Zn ribbon-like protein
MVTRSLRGRPASSINLIGGRLCLDFVNSMGARQVGSTGEMLVRDENLNDYLDLVAWAHHAGALTTLQAKALEKQASLRQDEARKVLRRGLTLREALYRTLRAILAHRVPQRHDLDIVNEEVQRAQSARQIVTTHGRFEWRWCLLDGHLDAILWLISESAAEFLTTSDLSRLRQCGGDDCGWLFEDSTRNRSRHWCDMRDCGNRARVRNFRVRRHQASAASERTR